MSALPVEELRQLIVTVIDNIRHTSRASGFTLPCRPARGSSKPSPVTPSTCFFETPILRRIKPNGGDVDGSRCSTSRYGQRRFERTD